MRQQLKQHSRPFTTADVDVTTATKGQQMPKSPQQRMAKPTSNPSQQRRMNPKPKPPQRRKMKPKPPQQRRARTTPKLPQQKPHPDEIRVSSTTNPEKLASAMNHQRKEGKTAFRVRLIGAGANNQLTKAVARLRERLRQRGILPMMTPSFFVTDIEGRETTGISWSIVFVPMSK